MKKALINQLKLEFMERLTIEERGRIIKELLESGMGYFTIARKIGKNQSTIHRWVHGRKDSPQVKKIVDIAVLIRHFSDYMPKDNKEKEDIKKLCLILMDCVKRTRRLNDETN